MHQLRRTDGPPAGRPASLARFKIGNDCLLLDALRLTAVSGIRDNRAIGPMGTVSAMDMQKDVQPGLNPSDGRKQFPTPVAAISSTRAIKRSERRTLRDEDVCAFLPEFRIRCVRGRRRHCARMRHRIGWSRVSPTL